MEYSQLGKPGIKVSRLGVGISEIGFNLTLDDEKQASVVLNTALDQRINFFDTAACYGLGEEFVGRSVSDRREEFFLATKAGHVAGDYEGEAWTPRTITDSIDRSLKRMHTDHLDLIQRHSCSVEVLELALGFNLVHPEINVAIVGTLNPKHMRNNPEMIENSLPIVDSIH